MARKASRLTEPATCSLDGSYRLSFWRPFVSKSATSPHINSNKERKIDDDDKRHFALDHRGYSSRDGSPRYPITEQRHGVQRRRAHGAWSHWPASSAGRDT